MGKIKQNQKMAITYDNVAWSFLSQRMPQEVKAPSRPYSLHPRNGKIDHKKPPTKQPKMDKPATLFVIRLACNCLAMTKYRFHEIAISKYNDDKPKQYTMNPSR
ncbi:hypothetical protein ACJMK2_034687 [Sinanodonta woodiana]|uniref:Uncharacterized protein n=1 Tax=Sinanodonta woodiana TaxID=1069815 RepID=A0ABD3WSF2_SINWO